MKYLDEYRDPSLAQAILKEIEATVTQPWVLMEICGGQTHSLMRYGIDELIPQQIQLVHGPGCPVCVTPLEMIDKAIEIAARPEVIFITYGDMMRVPGSSTDLLQVKARGGDVRFVYSPMQALDVARKNPGRRGRREGNVRFPRPASVHAILARHPDSTDRLRGESISTQPP